MPAGDAMGRIVIPKIGASFDIVQGTDAASLEKGPGTTPRPRCPGSARRSRSPGTGPRTWPRSATSTRSSPAIRSSVRCPTRDFTYTVQYHRIVLPTALWVIKNVGYDRLVLSACNPLYSAAQRIIVFAKMTHFQPLGAARATA